MTNPRIEKLQQMLERAPADPRPRLGLAMEYEKLQQWEDVVLHLRAYLDAASDEGNAWGRLGHALRSLGRDAEAREAYERGIAEARAHGHPSMAMEFEEVLGDW